MLSRAFAFGDNICLDTWPKTITFVANGNCYVRLRKNGLPVSVVSIERKSYVTYVGVRMDSNLCWKYHISHIASKISINIGTIARLRHFKPFVTLLNIYRSLISPSISYGLIAWGQTAKTHLNKILLLQKGVVRLMNFAKFSVHAVPLFISTNILPSPLLYFKNCSVLMHDVYNKVVPSNSSDLFIPTKDVHDYNTHSSTAGNFYINYSRLNHYKNSFPLWAQKFGTVFQMNWDSSQNIDSRKK